MNYKYLRAIFMIGALALIVTLGSNPYVQAEEHTDEAVPAATDFGLATANDIAPVYGVSETGLYIVQFTEPSLASYTGGIAGLAATSPEATGARKLDANSPASRAYIQYLTDNQNQFAAELSQNLDRSVEVAFNYTGVLNAIAVAVSHGEAAQIAAMSGVSAVYGDTMRELTTDVGPIHIGAPSIWNAQTGSGSGTRGEGVVIGIIDSGINSQHPSFAATDGEGYTHTNPYGAGVYKGWCAANAGFCNSKLIAAYGLNPVGGNPEDIDGHGSHTASTAGGNKHDAIFNVGITPYDIELSGVAPRANIVAYKVCNPGCPGTASIAAVNSAITNDMVDVLNYSISGSDFPWNDPVDLAFLDASNAGIFVSASAGNAGPGASTVAKTGPWNAAVAASTINRVIAHTLDVTGPTPPPALQGLAAVPGENTAIAADINGPLRYVAANNTGCTAFAAGAFTGSLALIQRGGCTFAVKVTNAANAGATGVVMLNSVGGPPISMGGLTGTPPAVMLDLDNGLALRDYVLANPTSTTVRINTATSYLIDNDWEDIVAGFSSRGPSQYEILKPDYIAPGVNILAASMTMPGNPAQYEFLQGTSMSSPHGAGAAALMMGLHPTWSPAEIRSALASTATGGLLKEDGLTPADPFDVGSGLLALGGASNVGLVFDETGANYAAANPAIGGDPKTLNQPSMVDYDCAGSCTWERTVKSVLTEAITYTANISGPAGMVITVEPSVFTIPAGGTQTLTITADVSALAPGGYAFGSVALQTGPTVADTHMPVVVIPVSVPAPAIEVNPDALTSIQAWDTQTEHTLTISNTGAADLNWSIAEAAPLAAAGSVPPAILNLPLGGDRATPTPAGVTAPASILPTSYTPILTSWAENFDDITLLPGLGWALINNSAPAGVTSWFQGNSAVFPAHAGAPTAYIAANFNNTAGEGTISNWLLTPEMTMRNGDQLSFYTRRTASATFQDRLQVRLSVNGASTHVGATGTSVGDFTTLLLDINPTYAPGGYPQVWTEYVITISGLSGPTNGRLAFRYFVENGGPSGANSDYIGIDTVTYRLGTNVLYENGPFITSYGDGPDGANVSLLQNVSLGMTTFGASVFPDSGPHWRIAEAFTVTTPGGWSLENVIFYAYQTGSSITSTFTGVNYQIWDGPPNDPGSTVIYGDTSTNRLEETGWTGVYRYTENSPGTTRPIMYIIGEADVHLMPGVYWLDWQLAGSLASGPFQPPITIIGETTTGNALQLASGGWINFLDFGAGTAQGAPFQLWGATVCDNPSDVSWISVDPASGTTAPGGASEVKVTLDSTGVPAGDYVAYLCLNSDDPENPVIVMPVHMTVTETSYQLYLPIIVK
jgi:subtilisin family serine protease